VANYGRSYNCFILFLGLWGFSASKVNTSLGAIPGPVAVWHEAGGLLAEHYAEKQKEVEYYQRQQERNKQKLAENPQAEIKIRPITAKPLIWTRFSRVYIRFLQAL